MTVNEPLRTRLVRPRPARRRLPPGTASGRRPRWRSHLALVCTLALAAPAVLGPAAPVVQAGPTAVKVLTAGSANVNGRKDAAYIRRGAFTENGTSGGTAIAELFSLYEEGATSRCPAGELFVYVKMKTPGTNGRSMADPSLLEFRVDEDNDEIDAESVLSFAAGPAYHDLRTGAEFSVCYTTVDEAEGGQGIAINFRWNGGGETNANRLALLEGATNSTDIGLTIATPTAPPPPPPSGTLALPGSPVRILDTRNGTGLYGEFKAKVWRTLDVAGEFGIPSNAFAIAGNLTVVRPDAGGFVTLFVEELGPGETPPVSNINVRTNDVRPNNFVARLAADGTLAIVYWTGAQGAQADLVLDVTGYFVPDTNLGHYVDLAPARILDSRKNVGVTGMFNSNVPRTFQVRGRGGVPNNPSVVAVAGNLTVTGQTNTGNASLTTNPTTTPGTSTLNFPVGDNRANGVILRLSNSGTLSAVVKGARAHLIFDVTGYFVSGPTGTIYHPIESVRRLDTRTGIGLTGPFVSGQPRTVTTAPGTGVPAGAVGITGNLTVTRQTDRGWVAMTKTPQNAPSTSTLNFPVGENRANGVVAPLSSGKASFVYRSATNARTDLILDVSGYFAP